MKLSAFGDEISDDLDAQLICLRALNIGYLELRGVWGKNVLRLNDTEVQAIATACTDQGISVSAIGSPIGKSPITNPISDELSNMERIIAIADQLGTRLIRVFSFYPPSVPETAWSDAALLEESISRLSALTQVAAGADVKLLLENEHGIVGDSVARCHLLLDAVQSPYLAFAWDPANFVHVGEAAAVDEGWESLGPRTAHVHIKDYRMSTGEVLPAGEGDGQIEQLLKNLAAARFNGFLALEPHLTYAGHSSGFSGPEGMERAATALRSVLATCGIPEEKPDWVEGQNA